MLTSVVHSQSKLKWTTEDLVPMSSEKSLTKFITETSVSTVISSFSDKVKFFEICLQLSARRPDQWKMNKKFHYL